MYMVAVFSTFALVAGATGLLMPHLVRNLGFLLAALYLGLAICAALINILRRAD